ncbi:MAG: NADPH-dependent FMN reductase [Bacteriovoracaceae bacterium]
MKVLGICGSSRLNSVNRLILNLIKQELNHLNWFEFDLATLPFFDPDNQYSNSTPKSVLEIRNLASCADRIIISTPEYAHGIPGVLKNGLEWIFHEGTMKKPVYVIIGSGQGEHTRDQLIEVLSTMDFKITLDQVLLIKGARSKIDLNGKIINQDTEYIFKKFCQKIVT